MRAKEELKDGGHAAGVVGSVCPSRSMIRWIQLCTRECAAYTGVIVESGVALLSQIHLSLFQWKFSLWPWLEDATSHPDVDYRECVVRRRAVDGRSEE